MPRHSAASHTLRITGGSLRGRKLSVPAGDHVRPTAERTREALFNRLAHGNFGQGGASILVGARVLDLCSGTGALALEALSRGAAHATLVDSEGRTLDLARANARTLGVESACAILRANLPNGMPAGPFDLIFFDPPYAAGLYEPVLAKIAAGTMLRPGGLVSVETPAQEALAIPPALTLIHDQRYGKTRLFLLQRPENA